MRMSRPSRSRRSAQQADMLDDAELNHRTNQYRRLRMHDRCGVSLVAFLANPDHYINKAGAAQGEGRGPRRWPGP